MVAQWELGGAGALSQSRLFRPGGSGGGALISLENTKRGEICRLKQKPI